MILSKTQAFEWYKAFKYGLDVVEDMPGSGRHSTSSTDKNLKKMLLETSHARRA